LKKQFFPERRFLITYITLDISYCSNTKVRIRKIHKYNESEVLKKSKYKIDEETYVYDNQIELNMFYQYKTEPPDFFRKRYLNLKNEEFKTEFKDLSKYGADFFRIEKYFTIPHVNLSKGRIDIYVRMKNPDEQLIDNLCNTLHQLCKKYLKTSIMITGRDSIICRIDDCSYSRYILNSFLEDFVIKTEKTILKEI